MEYKYGTPIRATLVSLLLSGSAMPIYALEVSATISSEHSNNALKNDANKFSERQDSLKLGLKHDIETSRSQILFNYDFDYEHFEKDSQDNELQIKGSTNALIELSPWLNANLSHSVTQLLDTPDQAVLANNTDNRHIVSGSFDFSFAPEGANRFILSPQFTLVRFRDASESDSSRHGLQASLLRNINPLTKLRINALHQKIDYEQGSDGNFSSISASLNHKLRLIEYEAEIGYNKISSASGQDLSEPSLQLKAEYDDGYHQINAHYQRQVTDSSLGNNNSVESNIDGNRTGIDQLEIEQFTFSYAFAGLCGSCDLNSSLSLLNEEYSSQPSENLEEKKLSISLRYRLTPLSNLTGSFNYTRAALPANSIRNYNERAFSIAYSQQLGKHLTFSALSDYENRNSNSPSGSYSEWVNGLSLRYTF